MELTTSSPKSENLTETQHTLLLLEEEIFSAVKNMDTKALDAVLANEFIYRSPGREIARDDFLKLCSNFPDKIKSIQGKELKANVYEHVAVVTGLQIARTEGQDGKVEKSSVAFTDVFVKQNNKWMLSLAYAVLAE